jgi:hypothetical protein
MASYSGFSHEKWWFSIAMLVYQRVRPSWREGFWTLGSKWNNCEQPIQQRGYSNQASNQAIRGTFLNTPHRSITQWSPKRSSPPTDPKKEMLPPACQDLLETPEEGKLGNAVLWRIKVLTNCSPLHINRLFSDTMTLAGHQVCRSPASHQFIPLKSHGNWW